MTHPSLDPFSQEPLRRIVPTGPDGQPLPVADLRVQHETLCLVLSNLPLPGRTEVQFTSQIAASHVTVMECFRPAMLNDVSDRTWQHWVRGVAAHALHAGPSPPSGIARATMASGDARRRPIAPDALAPGTISWGTIAPGTVGSGTIALRVDDHGLDAYKPPPATGVPLG